MSSTPGDKGSAPKQQRLSDAGAAPTLSLASSEMKSSSSAPQLLPKKSPPKRLSPQMPTLHAQPSSSAPPGPPQLQAQAHRVQHGQQMKLPVSPAQQVVSPTSRPMLPRPPQPGQLQQHMMHAPGGVNAGAQPPRLQNIAPRAPQPHMMPVIVNKGPTSSAQQFAYLNGRPVKVMSGTTMPQQLLPMNVNMMMHPQLVQQVQQVAPQQQQVFVEQQQGGSTSQIFPQQQAPKILVLPNGQLIHHQEHVQLISQQQMQQQQNQMQRQQQIVYVNTPNGMVQMSHSQLMQAQGQGQLVAGPMMRGVQAVHQQPPMQGGQPGGQPPQMVQVHMMQQQQQQAGAEGTPRKGVSGGGGGGGGGPSEMSVIQYLQSNSNGSAAEATGDAAPQLEAETGPPPLIDEAREPEVEDDVPEDPIKAVGDPVDAMFVKEALAFRERNREPGQPITHLIDGFEIEESDSPFPCDQFVHLQENVPEEILGQHMRAFDGSRPSRGKKRALEKDEKKKEAKEEEEENDDDDKDEEDSAGSIARMTREAEKKRAKEDKKEENWEDPLARRRKRRSRTGEREEREKETTPRGGMVTRGRSTTTKRDELASPKVSSEPRAKGRGRRQGELQMLLSMDFGPAAAASPFLTEERSCSVSPKKKEETEKEKQEKGRRKSGGSKKDKKDEASTSRAVEEVEVAEEETGVEEERKRKKGDGPKKEDEGCLFCNKSFSECDRWAEQPQYCSKECRRKWMKVQARHKIAHDLNNPPKACRSVLNTLLSSSSSSSEASPASQPPKAGTPVSLTSKTPTPVATPQPRTPTPKNTSPRAPTPKTAAPTPPVVDTPATARPTPPIRSPTPATPSSSATYSNLTVEAMEAWTVAEVASWVLCVTGSEECAATFRTEAMDGNALVFAAGQSDFRAQLKDLNISYGHVLKMLKALTGLNVLASELEKKRDSLS